MILTTTSQTARVDCCGVLVAPLHIYLSLVERVVGLWSEVVRWCVRPDCQLSNVRNCFLRKQKTIKCPRFSIFPLRGNFLCKLHDVKWIYRKHKFNATNIPQNRLGESVFDSRLREPNRTSHNFFFKFINTTTSTKKNNFFVLVCLFLFP